MDYSLPGSSVHGILQARVLEWVAIKNSMDRGAWQATVQRVAKSQTWLSDWARMQGVSVGGRLGKEGPGFKYIYG